MKKYYILDALDKIEKGDERIDPGFFVWRKVSFDTIGMTLRDLERIDNESIEIRREIIE